MFSGRELPPNPTRGQRAAHTRAFNRWAADERQRIADQRRVFAENLGPARAKLQAMMLDRAWALLEAGECEACDALLEFVPESAADQLLDEFFGDEI